MKSSRFLRALLVSSMASTLILQAGMSFADDTEIFFGGAAIDEGIRPNVMFILDDSGSMNWCVDSTSTQTCSNVSKQRMVILRDTFRNLLNNTSNINIGMMVLNNVQGQDAYTNPARMLYPATYIDTPLNATLASAELKISADDASRQTTSPTSTNISDPTLVMGYIKNPGSGTIVRSLGSDSVYSNDNTTYYVRSSNACSVKLSVNTTECPRSSTTTQINARNDSNGNDGLFLFRNLNIPKGVTITSATLSLNTGTSNLSAQAFSVRALNSKTPEAFNDSEAVPTDSEFTATTTITSTKSGNFEHRLNVQSLVQSLQNLAPSSNPVSDIALRLRGTTTTNFRYNVGDTTSSPTLTITYTGAENTSRTTGLRFQTVAIPRNATITSAKLYFVPAGSDDRPVSFDVAVQDSGNAAVFSTSEDFSLRSKTSTRSWAASEWRTQTPPVHVEGPDVTAQVQNIVSRSDWCGNNAMAFFLTPTSGEGARTTYSLDGNEGLKPMLNITFSGGESGCLNPIVETSLLDAKDDARQYHFDNSNTKRVSVSESTLDFSSNTSSTIYNRTIIGARFQKVPFMPNATVLEASVIVTPTSAAGTSASTTVYFENVGNSAIFSAGNNNDSLGSRSRTAGTSCTFTSAGPGIPVTCSSSSLATALQSILTTAKGWQDGNALSVLITQSAASSLKLSAYETSPASAIRLRVKLQTGGLGVNSYKVRDHLRALTDSMQANDGTPLVDTMRQAASYYTSISGKHQGPASPINSNCQSNHLVLMTDGQANNNNSTIISNSQTLTGTTCTARSNSGETCGPEIASWLSNTDQAPAIADKNTVTTHTVGFALQTNTTAKQFLIDVAKAGGGKAYDANNASELASAFDSIIQEVLATNTTFVNTTAPVNSFNRQDNKDQLYFSLFRPSETNRWVGNLKRYRFGATSNGTYAILDADDAVAINPSTGFFKSTARSFWTPDASRDGDDIAKGGAALQLPAPNSRKLYTYYSGSTIKELTNAANALSAASQAALGASSPTEQANLLNYIKGLNTDSTIRKNLGDPIHSSPRLLTYGCKGYNSNKECLDSNGQDNADQYALIGTNEGFIQMIDTSNGQEAFAFMPEALLPNIKKLYYDDKTTATNVRPYGMDNTVSIWVNDVNGNGVIYGNPKATPPTTSGLNTGEFVYAYGTMGRGGRNIYALDITEKANPKMLWQIIGGSTAGFERLGQTWSVPVKTKIKVGNTITDVLIFAGGYDPAQDNLNQADSVYAADNQGNALYIVNAKTGALIWSASSANGHTLQLPKMKYSIPSSVRVIDLQESNGSLVTDPDQLADQIFVGDMGGQIWRLFINNGQTGASLVTAGGSNGDGVFASLGGTTPGSARRFYNEPDVALVNFNGARSLAISIGSGYRGHPLNKFIEDRFYSLRTAKLTKGLAETSINEGTLTESNLYDATDNLVQSSSLLEKNAAITSLNASKGWYIQLAGTGEKVLSRALTIAGQVFFNTYEPSSSAGACKASVGRNRSYAMRLDDASPIAIPVGSTGSYADRFTNSNSQGISGDPQLFCQGNDCFVLPDPSLPPEKVKVPPLGKTFWIDSLNFD